jgi:AbrB family looped-hinge helix DNA binding protein
MSRDQERLKEREARVVIDKGRITIPAAFLKDLDISDGDRLVFRIEDDELRVAKLPKHG